MYFHLAYLIYMKYFFATIIAYLSIMANGQKIFEGIIRYEFIVKM